MSCFSHLFPNLTKLKQGHVNQSFSHNFGVLAVYLSNKFSEVRVQLGFSLIVHQYQKSVIQSR